MKEELPINIDIPPIKIIEFSNVEEKDVEPTLRLLKRILQNATEDATEKFYTFVKNQHQEIAIESVEEKLQKTASTQSLDKDSPKRKPSEEGNYLVQKGDTLWKLAKKFNITVDELARLNNIDDVNLIYEKEKLWVPNIQKVTEKSLFDSNHSLFIDPTVARDKTYVAPKPFRIPMGKVPITYPEGSDIGFIHNPGRTVKGNRIPAWALYTYELVEDEDGTSFVKIERRGYDDTWFTRKLSSLTNPHQLWLKPANAEPNQYGKQGVHFNSMEELEDAAIKFATGQIDFGKVYDIYRKESWQTFREIVAMDMALRAYGTAERHIDRKVQGAIAKAGSKKVTPLKKNATVIEFNKTKALNDALAPYNDVSTFTKAGRAVTKHPQYFGYESMETLTKVYKTPEALNKLASSTIENILQNGVKTVGAGGRYPGGWVTYTLPNGTAASWTSDGSFIGFRGLR